MNDWEGGWKEMQAGAWVLDWMFDHVLCMMAKACWSVKGRRSVMHDKDDPTDCDDDSHHDEF